MAALPEPPHNLPRIVEPIDPLDQSGIHMVQVLMPTHVANKWPAKPWGTSITEIGLNASDTARFKDYTLVDIQSVKGSADLYWLFTKLPGKVVTESEWNDDLQAQVQRTQQYVAPPTDFSESLTSFKKVYWGMSLKEKETVPTETLDAFVLSFPTRVNLGDLPRELTAVTIVWNSQSSIGTQDYSFYKWVVGTSINLSKSASDSANSSAAISPEIQLTFRDLATGNLYGTRYEFFLPNPVTEAAILAKLATLAGSSVSIWPVFHPESNTITSTSQSISVTSNVQISLEGSASAAEGLTSQGWDKGTSDNFGVSLSNGSVQVPPCIHGPIIFTSPSVGSATSRSQAVAATAYMSMFNSLVGSIDAIKNTEGTAYGTVSPTSLPAVPGTHKTIPTTGLFLMDMDVRRYRWDYCQITAVVFDATSLA